MFTLITTMTGCGFVSPGNDEDGGSYLVYKNKEENKLYKTNESGGSASIPWDGPYSMYLKPSADYGFDPKDGGLTLFRDAASFMYRSVFSTNSGGLATYPISGDQFKGDSDWGGVKLEAGAMTRSITKTLASNDDVMSSVFNICKTLAFVILTIMWACSYLSMVVNERFTPEAFIKGLLQFAIGSLVIQHSETLANAFLQMGNLIIERATGDGSFNFSTFATAVSTELNKGAFSLNLGMDIVIPIAIGSFWVDISALLCIVFMLIPMVIQIITAYKIASIMLIRVIELKARLTFAPIPLAFSLHNGFNTEAIRFFRELMACVLQPALIMVGVSCLPQISAAVAKVFGVTGGGSVMGMASGAIIMSVSYLVFNAFLGQVKSIIMDIIVR